MGNDGELLCGQRRRLLRDDIDTEGCTMSVKGLEDGGRFHFWNTEGMSIWSFFSEQKGEFQIVQQRLF